jgi:competence protein ComEA
MQPLFVFLSGRRMKQVRFKPMLSRLHAVRVAVTPLLRVRPLILLMVLGLSTAQAVALDLNQASVQELLQIKGIGRATAERIVAERKRGPFESLAHLGERVTGLGQKRLQQFQASGLCVQRADQPCDQSVLTPSPTSRSARRGSFLEVTPELMAVSGPKGSSPQ